MSFDNSVFGDVTARRSKIHTKQVAWSVIGSIGHCQSFMSWLASQVTQLGIKPIFLYTRQIESIIGVQRGQENPNHRVHRCRRKRGLQSFHWNGRPEGWDFPVDTGYQRSILFLTYHHRIVLRMTTPCFTMEVSEVNERNKNIQHSQIILVPKFSFCSN